jgi:hypothetical protein
MRPNGRNLDIEHPSPALLVVKGAFVASYHQETLSVHNANALERNGNRFSYV